MADNSPILIGRDNIADPGAETLLSRDANSTSTDPVFTVRTPVGGDGIHGEASNSTGVQGTSTTGHGVQGASTDGHGVQGKSDSRTGVEGGSTNGFGVEGFSSTSVGVRGFSTSSSGVSGTTSSGFASGVRGHSPGGFGVTGSSLSGQGVFGFSLETGIGVSGQAAPNSGKAGFFDGGITVILGPKKFQIDHPLDPENKYLEHTCVESSEMKNVYDGVARLDEEGAAWVELPE